MDAARLQQARDGNEPLPTWKAYSRIDFILLPPTLVPLFQTYLNFPDTVSDHSEIQVNLAIPQSCIHRQNWKPSRDMRSFVESEGWQETDFAHIDWQTFHRHVCERDVNASYKVFCQNFEIMVAEARNRLGLDIPLQQFQGRPVPKIVSRPIHAPLVRPARCGEHHVQVDDAPTVFRQRIRQARRVNTLRHQLMCCIQRDTDTSSSLVAAARDTWQAVRNSTGFPGGFPLFAQREFGLVLPMAIHPDDLLVIDLLNSALQGTLAKWQWQFSKTKRHQYLNYMLSDWQKGGRVHFASIRPSPKPEIALLEVPYPMDVIRHRHHKDGPFVLTCLDSIPDGVAFVQFHNQRRSIIRCQPPHLWLNGPVSGTSAKVKVNLLKPTGSLSEIHGITIQYWSKFWKSEDTAQVDKALDILSDFVPLAPLDQRITLQEVQSALKRIKWDKARGPDSWSPWDLKGMPQPFQIALTSLFNLFVETAQWPVALTQATVAMLSKQDGAFAIEHTRQITILSMIYRVWSRIIARKFINRVNDHLPTSIQGNRPGSSAKWVACYVQTQIEMALYSSTEFNVASLVLTKAYNLLSRPLLRALWGFFGIPAQLFESYHAFFG